MAVRGLDMSASGESIPDRRQCQQKFLKEKQPDIFTYLKEEAKSGNSDSQVSEKTGGGNRT